MNIKYRKYNEKDARECAEVVRKTFLSFNNKEGTKKAVEKYSSWYDISKRSLEDIKNNFSRTNIFYVALDNKRVVGLIRGNKNRVINLFLLGKYHGKGIGRKLIDLFEAEAISQGCSEIKINSSIYAVSFYQSVGYVKTTGIRNFSRLSGLRVQPMIKRFRK